MPWCHPLPQAQYIMPMRYPLPQTIDGSVYSATGQCLTLACSILGFLLEMIMCYFRRPL